MENLKDYELADYNLLKNILKLIEHHDFYNSIIPERSDIYLTCHEYLKLLKIKIGERILTERDE